jgi:membrane protein YqaA with SNARE-associated domain
MVTQSYNNLILLLTASMGNILGSSFNWVLGIYSRKFDSKKWFPFNQNQMKRSSKWFLKYGKWSLLFAWLPIVGDPLTFVAGAMRTRFLDFLILVAVGKVGRYLVVMAATDWFLNLF